MSKKKNLSKYEIELEEKLKNKPTPEQRQWYNFACRNIGFDFLNLTTGRAYSKLAFFHKFKDSPNKLNLACENLLVDWKRRVKDGWTAVDTGFGPATAMRRENVPKYKKDK